VRALRLPLARVDERTCGSRVIQRAWRLRPDECWPHPFGRQPIVSAMGSTHDHCISSGPGPCGPSCPGLAGTGGPIYTNVGFSLTFNTAPGAPEAHVRVTCNVAHRAGHVRTYMLDLPADGKGAKGGDTMSRTQATASALSYGMRYLLRLIFNIAVGEGDDDGNKAGAPAELAGHHFGRAAGAAQEADRRGRGRHDRFCRYMKVARLEDLPASRFRTATAALEAKKATGGA